MNEDFSPNDQLHAEPRARTLDNLIRDDAAIHHKPKWSKFVRRARLIMPVIAIALFAVVFVWGDIQKHNIMPKIEEAAKLAPTVGQNELVNPKFESTDSENQPYTITAKRAVQNKDDEKLVMLDGPLGDMKLKGGDTVGGSADRGSFRQDTKILLLRGNVKLTHDKGYELNTEELDIDMGASTATSTVDVTGKGPEGTLDARGLQGNSTTGLLVFNGPAKLILTNTSGKTELLP